MGVAVQATRLQQIQDSNRFVQGSSLVAVRAKLTRLLNEQIRCYFESVVVFGGTTYG
jgi:hypothetical protein